MKYWQIDSYPDHYYSTTVFNILLLWRRPILRHLCHSYKGLRNWSRQRKWRSWSHWGAAWKEEKYKKFKKGLITFHFSENIFSFSKWVSEWAFISKMWFFFEMCFHFQNVKGFMCVVFPFSEKHNCKQKFVNKNLYK